MQTRSSGSGADASSVESRRATTSTYGATAVRARSRAQAPSSSTTLTQPTTRLTLGFPSHSRTTGTRSGFRGSPDLQLVGDGARPRGRRRAPGADEEERASYSRAVRGAHVAVSGTAPLGPDGVLHAGDTYRQTVAAIEKALAAAAALGAARGDVIRTRLLLAPRAAREDAVRAHGEAFAGIAPANTTYVVAGFIPDVLVEVELDAIVPDAT